MAKLPPLYPGCYTVGRYLAGRIRHGEALAAALSRDASALELGALDPRDCLEALRTIGEARFAGGGGVVRLDVARDRERRPRLLGRARGLGPMRSPWRAVLHPELHPGWRPPGGVKRAGVTVLERARARSRRYGVDEALLVGADDCIVEGSQSNVFAVLRDGRLITPPLTSGAASGVARAIVLSGCPDAVEQPLPRASLRSLRELIVTSAVWGAESIARLDGAPIGSDHDSVSVRRLAALLDAAE